MPGKFYITTTIPYVNAEPHIGFALEVVQADMLARYRRNLGEEVYFSTGADEHGQKIYEKAVEEGKDPQVYVDENAVKFDNLKNALNLSYDNFIRTTDKEHVRAAQKLWELCDKNGDIEKKFYKIKYCVGCELEKTDSELVDGICPLHPNRELEDIEEENYFFKLSNYAKKLSDLYEKRPDFVVPANKLDEAKKLVIEGLRDFSISRLKEKLPWGVPVPGDDEHVMYVWFDALVNYISTIGWPDDQRKFEKWWPALQLAGKDQVRQQAVMWQAMLLSAGIEPSRQIFVHGFINVGGQKISKSVGNVVDPFYYTGKYGADAVRYYLVSHIHPFEDSDFDEAKFREAYQADLANGLGNFASRVSTLAEEAGELKNLKVDKQIELEIKNARKSAEEAIAGFRLHEAVEAAWNLIHFGDGYIDEKKPWESKDKNVIFNLVVLLDNIASLVLPVVPDAAQKITSAITWTDKDNIRVKKIQPIFPRLQEEDSGGKPRID